MKTGLKSKVVLVLKIAGCCGFLLLLVFCNVPFHNDLYSAAAVRLPTNSVTYDGGTLPIPTASPPAPSGLPPVDSTQYVAWCTVVIAGSGSLSDPSGNSLFGGWNTQLDSSGITYQPGSLFQMPNYPVTFYATWLSVSGGNLLGCPTNDYMLDVPEGITAIAGTFNQSNLRGIILPVSMLAIYSPSLAKSPYLTDIYLKGSSPFTLGTGALPPAVTIHVSSQAIVTLFKNDASWNIYTIVTP